MFGKKLSREDVEQYIASIMFAGENLEAYHIGGYDPPDFVAVTSLRFIGTDMAQSGGPIIRSLPFESVAGVSVTDSRDELRLGSGSVDYLVVHPGGSMNDISMLAGQQGESLFVVYKALMQKVFA